MSSCKVGTYAKLQTQHMYNNMAGTTGFEPISHGFGDRCFTLNYIPTLIRLTTSQLGG